MKIKNYFQDVWITFLSTKQTLFINNYFLAKQTILKRKALMTWKNLIAYILKCIFIYRKTSFGKHFYSPVSTLCIFLFLLKRNTFNISKYSQLTMFTTSYVMKTLVRGKYAYFLWPKTSPNVQIADAEDDDYKVRG